HQGRFFRHHKIPLTAGQPCTIELASHHFDTHLTLFDQTGNKKIAVNDDIAPENLDLSRIDFTPRETGEYVIGVVSSVPGQTGDYTLRIQGFKPASSP